MQGSPRRLRRLAGRPISPGFRAPDGGWPQNRRESRGVIRRLRAIRRVVLVLLWTALAMCVQSACLLLPGRAKFWFPRIYWSGVCRLLGMRVRLLGAAAAGGCPIVFVSNHSSWLDIPVLGGRLTACFVSKDDVARWPVIGTVARLGRTVFVSRQRTTTRRERNLMIERLGRGDNLVLFPEGTSSDGSRVLPFRSSFFAIVEDAVRPVVQPVSVVYDRLSGLPTGRAWRPLFAWYGDMDIASHVWRLAHHRGLRVTVILHRPLEPAAFIGRKELSNAVWAVVADSAAAVRQNRPARPLDAAPRSPAPAGHLSADP